jgi:hypothetical protein
MPGSVLIEGGFEAGRQPRRSILVGKITSRAGHPSAAAIASVRACRREFVARRAVLNPFDELSMDDLLKL